MATQKKRRLIQLFNLSQPKWTCSIDNGAGGILCSRFAPDSLHVLVSCDFNLRISIWSLVASSVYHIKFPKSNANQVTFNQQGNFMALAQRKEYKDYLAIFHTDTWTLVKQFAIDTNDCSSVVWSPEAGSSLIAVADYLLDYLILVYNTNGDQIAKYSAYQHGLGIKTLSWSKSGHFLAVGSFNEQITLFSHLTWTPLIEYEHEKLPDPAIPSNSHLIAYVESESSNLNSNDSSLNNSNSKSITQGPGKDEQGIGSNLPEPATKYIVSSLPIQIINVKPNLDAPDPAIGIGILLWSYDDSYLITRNDNMPNTLFVWDNRTLNLTAVLNQRKPIKCCAWDPVRVRCAFSCGGSKVYFWAPEGCSIVDVPTPNFCVRSLLWSSDGNIILLADKNKFCCCYIAEEKAKSNEI